MLINSSTNFTKRLDEYLDHHAKGPQLTLEANTSAGTVHTGKTDFDQVRGVRTEQASLGKALGDEWKSNLHSRQLVFAMSKLINTHRAERQRPRQATTAAESTSRSSVAEEGLNALNGSAALAEDIQRVLEDAPQDWPFRGACEGILRGAEDLRAALGETRAPAENDYDHDEHGHDHGGGAIVVDVDEAIHGLYAAISYLAQAMKGGGQEVAKQFSEEAQVLAHSPLEWVKDQGVPHGVADFAMGVSVGGALLPFSLLAMKAGVEEIHGARHEHKRLGKLKGQLLERLDRLKPAPSGGAIEGLEGVQRLQVEQQLEELAFSKQQNTDGGMVGVFSLSSGAAIAAKVGLETGAKSAFIATSGAAGPSAATAAAGIAGTFALGPLAAGSAMGLGAYMVHKSAAKAKAFKAEKQDTLAAHHGLREEQRTTPLKQYGDFLEQKLDQHQRFYDNYRDWNKGFLAGSGIYTAGTLAKVGMVAAVGAGAVALAEPVTLATVIALGAGGGAMMGASSHQFLSGHGRHHRYEKYFKKDDPELDRHFLAGADLLCLNDPDSGPLAGLELRSDFHQHIYQREERRQDLLERIAGETGKRFTGRYTYTADTEATREKRGDKPGKLERIKAQLNQRKENTAARLSSAKAFGSHLAGGHLSGAAQASRDTWNTQRTALSKTHVAQWLAHNDAGEPLETMKAMLDPQLAMVQKRLEIKLRTYAAVKLQGQGDLPLEDGRKLRNVLVDLDKDLAKDDLLYRQLTEVRHSLDQPGDDGERSARIGRFISLQMGKPHEEATVPLAQRHRDLAHYLLEDAPTRYRDLRGMLLETELQATRLRRRFHTAMTASHANWLTSSSPT
ncbi:hypothetical protein ALP90_05681 [Pseudomonas amygdali pv. ulmi]|uniref:Uncharacterized protein n=1 Tax=Pseudomonas amygdali pv. ulmi TaxID=251720 RepID=A0A3M4SJI8_PSEA0|nr:hypothetical protein [Pseudomonas amygdali]RMR15081.1 hypothetical protein ALP90_05681 [Pseudomonas amygdali pv. ulmi]